MRGLSANEKWRLEDLQFGYGSDSLFSGMGDSPILPSPPMFASDSLWMVSTLLPIPPTHRAPASPFSDVPGVPGQQPEATGTVCPLPFPEGQLG